MAEGKANKQEKPKVDEELSELLDSALQDFVTSDDKKEKVEEKKENPEEPNLGTEEWSEEFMKQATQQFDSNFMNLLGISGQGDASNISEDQMKQSFEHMAAAAQVFLNQDGGEPSADFAATISQAVQELSQGADPNLMGALGGGDQNGALPPFMHGMMQSLLSKEVLYPSLKDVLDRFPDWLESNKEKLSAEDKTRYENQQKLMNQVCSVLEKEQESESKEDKNRRFEEVLSLMQKLQEFGQPPTELVGDVGPAPDMNNCSLM